ncbi:MAG: murD [Haloplasmataceae bacterium]|jgi:UDP-N-acetylmuramoylalanine--D-glutamate ligase|nr:murD [Haloplasmataceae bacterium]
MIEFNNKRILVLGLKNSGKAAIKLLKTLNVEIFVSDELVKKQEILKEFNNITYLDYSSLDLDNIDIIVKSPGIKYDIKILEDARKKDILIISEIELAFHIINRKTVIVGITGTNGKTTTTTLITKILKDNNIDAYSVGNIGYSLSDAVLTHPNADVFVVELSSFQLLDIHFFKPHIALLLNISPAHLDYHHTFDNYINAKLNLVKNMGNDDFIVYNMDDEIIAKRIKKLKCQKVTFSFNSSKANAFVKNNNLIYNTKVFMNKDEIQLLGNHNLYNVLAAIDVTKVFYLENDKIANSIKTFVGLPHRIQFIKTINQVTYYNDSKSTNIESTICALDAMKKPVILILGGLDRNQDFEPIMKHKNVKSIVAYGQTKEKILKAAILFNKKCVACQDLQEVITLIYNKNEPDDIVLFSPACASWDQYKDYEERGHHFIDIVNQLNP